MAPMMMQNAMGHRRSTRPMGVILAKLTRMLIIMAIMKKLRTPALARGSLASRPNCLKRIPMTMPTIAVPIRPLVIEEVYFAILLARAPKNRQEARCRIGVLYLAGIRSIRALEVVGVDLAMASCLGSAAMILPVR